MSWNSAMKLDTPIKKRKASWPLKRTHGVNAELRVIAGLHRGGDSYVTFHRVDGGKFTNLFSICAAELEPQYLAHRNALRQDAYFSINGLWHYVLNGAGIPKPFIKGVFTRKAAHVRYLNACYSDVDCYKKGLTPTAALIKIGRLIQDGTLPPPSFGLQSRGLWLFWLLRAEKDPARPPRTGSRNLVAYNEIQKRIRRILADVGGDAAARDAARPARVPGSINSKNGAIVEVLWPPKTTQPATYTLKQLAHYFGVVLAEPTSPEKIELNGRIIEYLRRRRREKARSNPWHRVNDQRLRQFLALGGLRGGFSEGHRNRAAFIYARLLTTNGEIAEDVQTALEDFGQECTPQLTPSEIDSAVKSGTELRAKSIANETISEWLEIDWKEHAALKKEFGRYAWKPISSPPASPAELRRAEIMRLSKKRGVLPNRQMAALLQELGYKVSPTQVVKDYRALGIGPAKGARRRHSAARG
jgi:hypothetical protein